MENFIEMSAIKLSDNVYWVGVKDPGLVKFDIYMDLKSGTTYNSYLIKGEKTALIDAVKREFTAEYFDSIREIVPLAQNRLPRGQSYRAGSQRGHNGPSKRKSQTCKLSVRRRRCRLSKILSMPISRSAESRIMRLSIWAERS